MRVATWTSQICIASTLLFSAFGCTPSQAPAVMRDASGAPDAGPVGGDPQRMDAGDRGDSSTGLDAIPVGDASLPMDAGVDRSQDAATTTPVRPPILGNISRRLSNGNDDAEERSNGNMYLNSSDLEFVTDGERTQIVGMRFQAIDVPRGATIRGAYITFTTDETDDIETALILRAQAADDAIGFGANDGNISARPLSDANVLWSPEPWNTVGETHDTPDLSALIQEVVIRSGWQAGNAMVVVVSGTGKRTAESYEGSPNHAAQLHIEYEASAPICGDGECGGDETCGSCMQDCGPCGTGTPTVPDLLVAFIGDQGNNGNSNAVLELIQAEGAHAVVHNGDFDYQDNPSAWDNRITHVLGAEFPYFAVVGNHDAARWGGANGYAQKIAERHARNSEMVCTGELGVRADCRFRGLQIIESCIGTDELRSSCDANATDQINFLENTLATSDAIFKICAWHKNQNQMQVGGKGNEVGWQAYQTCMNAGAIVSTGHEHSYSRTLTLTDVGNASVAHGATGDFAAVRLGEGQNFVFVSGLAGVGIRTFSSSHENESWWATYYTRERWYKNGTMHEGVGAYGALFVRFHVDGNERKAEAYFKDINGRVVDEFTITAE